MNQKGFTKLVFLIVIILIGILMILFKPYVIDLMKKNKEQKVPGIEEISASKKAAAKRSLEGYIDAVELSLATTSASNLMDITAYDQTYITIDGNLYIKNDTSGEYIEVVFRGTMPKDKTGFITILNGRVTEAKLSFHEVEVTYQSNYNM